MKIELTQFPPLPATKAEGVPIYLEPVMGSGERICVAIAARMETGTFEVVPIVQHDLARCMLGTNASKLTGMVNLGIESLKRHLSIGGTIREWTPPISGLEPGTLINAKVHDLPMMMRTLARNHAFLARMSDFQADQEDEIDEETNKDRWITQVRQATASRDPSLEGAFSRQLQLVNGGATTRIDFIGSRFAAQLGRIIPGSQISNFAKMAKAKLWDLETLREVMHLQVAAPTQYELILYRPKDDDPTYSEHSIERLHEALLELEEAGDKQELRVRSVYTADEAAERIITAEAA